VLDHSHDKDPGVVDLDVGMCCSPASSTASESVINESIKPFPMSPPSLKMVKRIPRSARYKAAIVFESCLRDVMLVAHWDCLFNFASALRQPSSGGHRINLAARILAHLEEFHSGVVLIPKPAT